MVEKLNNVIFFNDDIDIDDIESGITPSFTDDVRLVTIDLN